MYIFSLFLCFFPLRFQREGGSMSHESCLFQTGGFGGSFFGGFAQSAVSVASGAFATAGPQVAQWVHQFFSLPKIVLCYFHSLKMS